MSRPRVLLLGSFVHLLDEFKAFSDKVEFVPSKAANRAEFVQALKDKTYGDFVAICKPHVEHGTEPNPWNAELIDLLPAGVKLFVAGGAGYDSVDTEALADRRGIIYCNARGFGFSL